MPSRLHLTAILGVAVLLWSALLIAQGVAVSIEWLRPFSMVIGALVGLLVAFDLWLWRLPFLHGWFVKRPNVRGTWRVELRSTWVDPQGTPGNPGIEGYLVIRQSFSRISLRLLTSESSSEVLGADIVASPDGTYRIYAVYRNEPKLERRAQSPIHYGGVLLEVEGQPADRLVGQYWTDRKTAGEIVAANRRRKLLASFEAGRGSFQSADEA